MEIKDMRKTNTVLFETLKRGDAFMWEGAVLVRIRDSMLMDVLCNAMDASNGDLFSFENTDLVEKLNAEIVIH